MVTGHIQNFMVCVYDLNFINELPTKLLLVTIDRLALKYHMSVSYDVIIMSGFWIRGPLSYYLKHTEKVGNTDMAAFQLIVLNTRSKKTRIMC